MPAASETLVALEQRLTEHLLDFALLDEAWPRLLDPGPNSLFRRENSLIRQLNSLFRFLGNSWLTY